MKVLELTLVPVGTGSSSLSSYVAGAVKILDSYPEIEYELNPMGTVMSGENSETLFKAVREMQESVFANGASRVYTVIKMDDRRDKDYGFKDKVKSVEAKLKK